MEVGFGRGVGRKGNGMTDFELMGAALEEARKAAALGEVPVGAVVAKDGEIISAAHNTRDGGGSGGCQDGDFGGGYECDDSRIPAGKRENSDEVCAGSGGEGVSGDGKRYRRRD